MTRLATVIMAHPDRAALVDELTARLDRLAPVVWEDGSNDRWSTGRRCLTVDTGSASHLLILQDDSVIPTDLCAAVERALHRVPDGALMSLYLGNTKRFWNALAATGVTVAGDTAWLVMPQAHWGVGLVYPVEHLEAIAEWGDSNPAAQTTRNYDRRVSRWCEATGTPVWYPWPSYISHREHTPSLVPGRQSWGRYAQRFIGDSALAHDVDGPATVIPKFRVTHGQIRPPIGAR